MDEYKNELLDLRGKIKIVVGGPPCQVFSLAGSRNRDDSRNTLSEAYLKFISLVQPEAILFENVSGFTVGFSDEDGRSESFSSILITSLGEMGYDVDAKIIDMSLFGVPQKRRRFILVGSRSHSAKTFFNILDKNRLKILNDKKLKVPISIEQAICDLQFKFGYVESEDSNGYQNGRYGNKNSNYIKLMRSGMRKNMLPDSHRFVKHKPETVEKFIKLMSISNEPIRVTP